jgi:hypothetical protein
MEKIEKVEPGTVVLFKGVEYVFGQNSSRTFNVWIDIISQGFPREKILGEIHIWGKNGESVLLNYQQIAEVLAKKAL